MATLYSAVRFSRMMALTGPLRKQQANLNSAHRVLL